MPSVDKNDEKEAASDERAENIWWDSCYKNLRI